MSDPYFEAIQEQWQNIRALYKTYESKKPVILYDIKGEKIYAYPHKDFKAEMSENSQASLEQPVQVNIGPWDHDCCCQR
jgi:hypothetical protein